MSLLYRIALMGSPKGPWRGKVSQARIDAVAQGLGEFDEAGQFWLDGAAEIEWVRQEELRRSA